MRTLSLGDERIRKDPGSAALLVAAAPAIAHPFPARASTLPKLKGKMEENVEVLYLGSKPLAPGAGVLMGTANTGSG